jgi:hypothetical protein
MNCRRGAKIEDQTAGQSADLSLRKRRERSLPSA